MSCLACRSPHRTAIDKALVGGTPLRSISARHGVSPSALQRHKRHVASAIVKHEGQTTGSVLRRIEELRLEAERIKAKAEKAGDLRTALLGVRELARLVAMVAAMVTTRRVLAEVGDTEEAMQELAAILGVAPEELPEPDVDDPDRDQDRDHDPVVVAEAEVLKVE